MASKQIQIFEASKMTLPEAIEESLASLNEYGRYFENWVTTFSGGKDSTATASLVAWAIKTKRVRPPKSFTVLRSNTKMEYAPLDLGAIQLMQEIANDGFLSKEVVPEMDHRFFVYMLGRGVPPPNSGRRWCTGKLKIEPMMRYLKANYSPDNTLTLTGVRLGESRSRDERIAVSCSKDSGECGQGWFQNEVNQIGFPSLAPIVHWRVCNVFDWLYFERETHGYPVTGITAVYGDDDIRTGCYKCNLVTEDKPLTKLAKTPGWEQLGALQELGQVYEWLERHDNRLMMPLSYNQDGSIKQKSGTVGPLTMESRRIGLTWVLDIQQRADVTLIDPEEEARIRELWALNTWPDGWTGNEPLASELQPKIQVITKSHFVNGQKKQKAIGYTTQDTLWIEN